MKNLKILNVVPSVSQLADGVGEFVRNHTDTLQSIGIDTRIATLEWAQTEYHPTYLKCFPLGYGPKQLGSSPQMRAWLKEKIVSNEFDVIHNHGMWMLPSVYVGRKIKKSNTKLIFSPHGSLSPIALESSRLLKSLFWNIFQKKVIKSVFCMHATAVSEYMDIRNFGVKKPVCILPIGVHVPPYWKKESCGQRKLLYLARVHPIKGLENLLHAWSVVQDRYLDWRLIIAGPDSGGFLMSILSLVRKLKLKRVEFRDAVYGDEKIKLLRDSDLYILPTKSENFGITVIEALSVGTPVIVTRAAPWEEVQRQGAGWWVDVGVDPLVYGLNVALSKSSSSLRQMGEAGHIWVSKQFSWKSLAPKYYETYKWVTGDGAIPQWVMID